LLFSAYATQTTECVAEAHNSFIHAHARFDTSLLFYVSSLTHCLCYEKCLKQVEPIACKRACAFTRWCDLYIWHTINLPKFLTYWLVLYFY